MSPGNIDIYGVYKRKGRSCTGWQVINKSKNGDHKKIERDIRGNLMAR